MDSFVCSRVSGYLFILFFVRRFRTSLARRRVVLDARSANCMHTWTTDCVENIPYEQQTVCTSDYMVRQNVWTANCKDTKLYAALMLTARMLSVGLVDDTCKTVWTQNSRQH